MIHELDGHLRLGPILPRSEKPPSLPLFAIEGRVRLNGLETRRRAGDQWHFHAFESINDTETSVLVSTPSNKLVPWRPVRLTRRQRCALIAAAARYARRPRPPAPDILLTASAPGPSSSATRDLSELRKGRIVCAAVVLACTLALTGFFLGILLLPGQLFVFAVVFGALIAAIYLLLILLTALTRFGVRFLGQDVADARMSDTTISGTLQTGEPFTERWSDFREHITTGEYITLTSATGKKYRLRGSNTTIRAWVERRLSHSGIGRQGPKMRDVELFLQTADHLQGRLVLGLLPPELTDKALARPPSDQAS